MQATVTFAPQANLYALFKFVVDGNEVSFMISVLSATGTTVTVDSSAGDWEHKLQFGTVFTSAVVTVVVNITVPDVCGSIYPWQQPFPFRDGKIRVQLQAAVDTHTEVRACVSSIQSKPGALRPLRGCPVACGYLTPPCHSASIPSLSRTSSCPLRPRLSMFAV